MALPGTCAARRWSTQLSVQAPETREDAGVFGFKRRRVCKKTCLEPPYPAAKEYRTALTGSEVPHKAYTTPTRITRDQSPCEVAALEALSARDFSYTAILNALSQTNIPQSSHRKNVIPKGESAVQGMALGLYAYGPKVGFSCSARQAPCLTRLLASFIQHTRPGFPFTSIQVNKNYAARPHVDRNNLGTSLIVGLGEYEGGSLWVHDDTGNVEAVLDEDVFSCHYYKSGNTYRGVELQVWNNIQEFDGNRLQFTRPFNGERFSLVFFTCDRYGDAPDEARIAMSQAGFAFSWEDPKLGMLLQEKLDTKRQAREELIIQRREQWRREREAMGRCFARTWNRGWGGACPHWRAPEGGDFCMGHAKGTWRTHGRIDGEVPELKQEEMRKWQKILLARGELPPNPLPHGALMLVELPENLEAALRFPEDLGEVVEYMK